MYASDSADRIIEEIEFIEAERRWLRENGPHFRIIHRSDRRCNSHDSFQEAVAVLLVCGSRYFQVMLGSVLIRLFDYMARHNRLAQTARQIENGTRTDTLFRMRHRKKARNYIPRRYTRVYVDRIRVALDQVFHESGLRIRPEAVLVSEDTVMNETGYRLRASFEWFRTTS
jgi:hypothetical protein